MLRVIKKKLFASFAGVMLADILANSVALLIILIIVTVAIKQEVENERLEQVKDVGVLLSREISRSVVVNSLPASAPAVLHDYENSPIDRIKTPTALPIIELHYGFIREYYTGNTFTRNELLLQDNRFDRYLNAMTPDQLVRLRVDIYSIDLFYIMMSILKAHKHSPRHWHFLAYKAGEKRTLGKPSIKGNNEDGEKGEEGEGGEGKDGEGNEAGGEAMQHGLPTENQAGEMNQGTESGQHGSPSGLPAHLSYDETGDGESAAYPRDNAADNPVSGSGQSGNEADEDINLAGEMGGEQSKETEQSDDVFEALTRMIGEGMSRQQNNTQPPTSARFRTATNQQAQPQGNQQSAVVQMPDFRALLPALFEFMKQVQKTADETGRSKLAQFDMIKQVFPLIGIVKETPQEKEFFDSINANLLGAQAGEDKEALPLAAEVDDARRGNVLAVPINQRINRATVVGNSHQSKINGIPGEMPVSSHLGLYPAIYKGIRSTLRSNMMVLMPKAEEKPQGFRWRAVTTVSPKSDDFIVAFVYAAIDEKGRLLIATDENAVEFDELTVPTYYPIVPWRSELWVMALYGLAALLIAFGVLRTFRRVA